MVLLIAAAFWTSIILLWRDGRYKLALAFAAVWVGAIFLGPHLPLPPRSQSSVVTAIQCLLTAITVISCKYNPANYSSMRPGKYQKK